MAVPIRHTCLSFELNTEELQELKEVYKKVKDFFGIETYFSCTRETMDYRSIEHYHTHFLP
jgi:diadenosine tetraphosphate (Ap4A) HIT family hydrolase